MLLDDFWKSERGRGISGLARATMMLVLLLTIAVGARAQSTYTVTFKDGTADKDKWTFSPAEAATTGVAEGAIVTMKYTGRKRVMSLRATKKTAAWDGDLSKLTGTEPEGFATATNGMTISGTLAATAKVKVTIADGATVTLKDATISGPSRPDYMWAGLSCLGNATIVLSGENSVKGFYHQYPGIHVPEGSTLTIRGDGSLDASGSRYGAGIGGGYKIACGNITIEGGTIEAKGGRLAAGIGGGYQASCGNITITSGVTKVTATKGDDSPCSIGKGNNGSCGTVTIGCTLDGEGNPVGGKVGEVSESPYTYPEPALGDLYYSDGSWSSTLVAGKTPIGVIAYLGTDEFTETGTTVGGSTFTGHGLVLCLKNAASGVKWSTETGAYEFGESARVNNADALKRKTDVSGYTNTATLAAKAYAATKYPAAYQAKNYTGLAAPATGTTGWFLPSAQQWVKMQEGLGGLAESDITWDDWFNTNHSAATAWETAMAKAGAKGTAYDSVTDDYLWYWSSSEYSAYSAVYLYIDATKTGTDYGFDWSYADKDYSYPLNRVRPVLAF